jgi:hypothetical protein
MAHDPLSQTCEPLKVCGAGPLVFALPLGIQASLDPVLPGPFLQAVEFDLVPDFEIGQGSQRDLKLGHQVV